MSASQQDPKRTHNAVEWWAKKLGFIGKDGGALAERRKKKIDKELKKAE